MGERGGEEKVKERRERRITRRGETGGEKDRKKEKDTLIWNRKRGT